MEHAIMECKKHGMVNHFLHKDKKRWDRWRCVPCASERVKIQRNRKKLWCVTYLGGKCKLCGYNKCVGALEFHHRNPEEKEFTFAKYMQSSEEKLKVELDKCDLLCANCHREEHERLLID